MSCKVELVRGGNNDKFMIIFTEDLVLFTLFYREVQDSLAQVSKQE